MSPALRAGTESRPLPPTAGQTAYQWPGQTPHSPPIIDTSRRPYQQTNSAAGPYQQPGSGEGQYQQPGGGGGQYQQPGSGEGQYQQPGGGERQYQQPVSAPPQPAFRHPSPMPQQRRPPEQRYTLRQYAHLVASYRAQQELYQQQQQQQPPVRRHSSPPEPWQTGGHYQIPPLWPRQTWVAACTPPSPRQGDGERRATVSPHRQPPPTGDRARRPTPAAGALATPPTVQQQAAPASAGAPATASDHRQSPGPRSRSPFSFGRYSLRVRGSEPAATEPPRPAEAEHVLRGPDRRKPLEQQLQQQHQQQHPASELPSNDAQKLKRLKKRWFFALPGKSKRDKKTKADDSSDDDGGFTAAGSSGSGESSFVRYESPDSVSSGVSSRASTPLTDASVSSSYFEMEQYFPSLNTSQGSGPAARPLSSMSEDSRSLRCQSSPQMRAPRPPNFSQLEYSPPASVAAAAAAAAAAEWRRQGPGAPAVQSPRLGPLPPPPAPVSPRSAGGQQCQWTGQAPRPVPAQDGSQIYGSPTVFARPRTPLTAGAGRGRSPAAAPPLGDPGQRSSWAGGGSPRGRPPSQRSSWSGGPPAPPSPARSQLTRPTPLNDFKELVARQGRSPTGGGGSAAERLRAAAASPALSPSSSPAPQSPLDARNSARAVLFQNRFGGRRRPPGTSVIASTIPETEDELSEDPPPPPLPTSRRQLFPAAGDGRSSSSGSSPDQGTAAPLRMSPSSPPPPYSAATDGRLLPSGLAADQRFTPVIGPTVGFRRSYSLPRPASDDQRPPIGSISRYQFRIRPGAALQSPAGSAVADSPFQRSRSLVARLPKSDDSRGLAGGVSGPATSQSPSTPRVETAI